MSDNNDIHEHILSHKLFLQRESNVSHLEYDKEMDFYEAVKEGDKEKIKQIMLPLKNSKLGKLSNNSLRNYKYHLVVAVALITRFCIEGGMPSETAYTLSDLYIQQVDLCTDEEEINSLHFKMVFDYADRMKQIRRIVGFSRNVIKATDYIYDHLQEKITLDQIAQAIGINRSYLCALFKKETKKTVFEYVMWLRIEAAANMLLFADYEPTEIANYFVFSSHSHFIKVFKKYQGMTPEEYRRSKYRKHWDR